MTIFNWITAALNSIAWALSGREREDEEWLEDPAWDSFSYWWFCAEQEALAEWSEWRGGTPPRWRLWLLTVRGIARDWALNVFWPLRRDYCEKFGHGEMRCDDWGGPESGGMGATCLRCGEGWSHCLY